MAAPRGKFAALVEHQTRRGNHGIPPDHRRRELRARVVIGNRLAVVVVAVGHDGIAVVLAAADEIELVAAHRTHLDGPESALPVERQTERIAVPERPDLCRDAPLGGEWIVPRHGTVRVETQDLAEVARHVLRRVELLAVAGADPEIPVAKRDAMAEVALAAHLRNLTPDRLEADEGATGPLELEAFRGRPPHRSCRSAPAST